MAKQFWTESCGDCSHLQWGRIEKFKFVEDGTGETPGCFDAELDSGYISACPLPPKEALDWWFPEKGNSKVCQNYDGKRPSKEEILAEVNSLEKTIQAF